MPLVPEPAAFSTATLAELRQSMREALEETRGLVEAPGARVNDPASLVTARDLLESALALLDRPSEREPRALADEVNVAYAVLVATIDLVKSHTDLPKVPRSRKSATAPAAAPPTARPPTRPRRSSRAG